MILRRTLRFSNSTYYSLNSPTKPSLLSSFFTNPSNLPTSQKQLFSPKFSPKKQDNNNTKSILSPQPNEFLKGLSPEAALLVTQLTEGGYLKNVNFGRLSSFCSRSVVKFAAEKFGRDHQQIAKWLNGSHLKKVALFGCPTIETKSVFAAKRLRSFFQIQEVTTCRSCELKASCKFKNQRAGRVENVILADVMRLISVYTLDSVPQPLFISDDLKSSVGKLLKEVLNLSK